MVFSITLLVKFVSGETNIFIIYFKYNQHNDPHWLLFFYNNMNFYNRNRILGYNSKSANYFNILNVPIIKANSLYPLHKNYTNHSSFKVFIFLIQCNDSTEYHD